MSYDSGIYVPFLPVITGLKRRLIGALTRSRTELRGLQNRCIASNASRAWCRRQDLNPQPSPYEGAALPLRHAGIDALIQSIKRPGLARPKEIPRCPETTVCRPTKGDQYRISGPPYVLAGTAILNSKTHYVITRLVAAGGDPPAPIAGCN